MFRIGLVFVLVLAGCDLIRGKKSAEPPPAPVVAAAEPQPSNTDCEGLEYAGPASLAVWKMGNGTELVVCEFGSGSERLSEESFSGWVNIAQRSNGSLSAVIPEVKSEKPNDVYSFVVQKVSDSEVRVRRQIRPLREDIGDESLTVMERTISCAKPGACDVGKEKCAAFKKDMLVDKDAVATVRDVVAGKQKVEELGAYDMIIGKLVQAAIAGDPQAKKLMLSTPEAKLKIDGAAAGSYFDGKHLLTAMQKLGCLN